MHVSKKALGVTAALVAALLVGAGVATAVASPDQPSAKPSAGQTAEPPGAAKKQGPSPVAEPSGAAEKQRASREQAQASGEAPFDKAPSDKAKPWDKTKMAQAAPDERSDASRLGIDPTGMSDEQVHQALVAYKVMLGAKANGSYDSYTKDAISRVLGIDTAGMSTAQITAAIEAKVGPSVARAVQAAQ